VSTVTAVFELTDARTAAGMERFLSLFDDLHAWTEEGCITSHDSAQTQVGRVDGEGLLLRVVGTREGIERLRFRLGKPVLVTDVACDFCLSATAVAEAEDTFEGSVWREHLCARCVSKGHAVTMPARERLLMHQVVDRWVEVALRTGPADRTAAESGVRAAYAAAGRPPPVVVWLDSHFAGALVASTISGVLLAGMGRRTAPVEDPALVDVARRAGRSLAGTSSLIPDSVEATVRPSVPPLVWKRMEIDVGRRYYFRVGNSLTDAICSEAMERIGSMVRGGDDDLPMRSWTAAAGQLPLQPWFRPTDLDWCHVRDTVWRDQDGVDRHVGVLTAAGTGFWLARTDFLMRSGRLRGPVPSFDPLRQVAEAAGSWWAFEHVVILTERPAVVRLDGDGTVHADGEAAVEYPDGFAVHAWHGHRVPRRVAVEPATLTVDDVDAEQDSHVRLVMVERAGGWTWYLDACGAEAIQQDECGTLWRKPGVGGEPVLLVSMEKATASARGTHVLSVLRVPPTAVTAREAVAWTFGLEPDEYDPIVEK
jgi:hypothetical protein